MQQLPAGITSNTRIPTQFFVSKTLVCYVNKNQQPNKRQKHVPPYKRMIYITKKRQRPHDVTLPLPGQFPNKSIATKINP